MTKRCMVMFVALATGCAASDDPGGTGPKSDTGVDAVADGSVDDTGRADSSADAAADGGSDLGTDAITDAITDGTLDAGGDAGGDVSEIGGDAAPVTGVRIEEIYVDRDLSGDAVEFVELRGPAGTSLETLHLRLLDATGKVTGDVAISGAGAVIPSSGLWVVGGSNVSKIFSSAHVDQTVGISKWGLDNTAGSVQLVDVGVTTSLLDVLGWGATIPAPSTPPTTTSEKTPPALPTTVGRTLGRRPGAADTNDNTADFCEQSGTPGATNGACL